MNVAPLAGVGVLVTRPEQQAAPLCRLLEAQGATALKLPMLEIRAFGERREILERAGDLEAYDLIVFVSANAVRFGATLLEQRRDLNLSAIGPATARALNQAGYRVAVQPKQYNTEGLLDHPRLKHIGGRRVLLVKGKEGRELLEQELARRGAEVTRAEVYERVALPWTQALEDALRARFGAGQIQVVTATSLDIGTHLLNPGAEELRDALQLAHWLVPGARVADGLRARGLKAPLLTARSADDQDLVSELVRWRSTA
ncbi:MAG TPA: uroporphyrinogen-III synthase [Steroidobacteraceae bacterium]|jgi:uroporphyrinogen-III synthase